MKNLAFWIESMKILTFCISSLQSSWHFVFCILHSGRLVGWLALFLCSTSCLLWIVVRCRDVAMLLSKLRDCLTRLSDWLWNVRWCAMVHNLVNWHTHLIYCATIVSFLVACYSVCLITVFDIKHFPFIWLIYKSISQLTFAASDLRCCTCLISMSSATSDPFWFSFHVLLTVSNPTILFNSSQGAPVH
jgi:hypothetical protein